MLPNFIIGGSAAAGTSFLGSAIIQHPDIYLPYPMEPECHFFLKSWEYEQGLSYYQEKWFSDVSSEIAIGERSSSYLFGGDLVAQRIYEACPSVKLIFTVRNPIERTWGNYRFTVLQGLESLSFKDALEQERERIAQQTGRWSEIQPHNYTGRGKYGANLQAFLKYFPREQILVIKSEQMSANPQEVFRQVFNFLNVDPNFSPCKSPEYVALSVKSPAKQVEFRELLGDRITPVLEAVRRKEDPVALAENDKECEIISELVKNLENTKFAMNYAEREYLQAYFENDISLLSKLTSLDFSDWN